MFSRRQAFLVPLIFITSCTIFQKDSYQGTWVFKITGDLSDSFEIVINEDNSFKTEQILEVDYQSYDATFEGKITEEGNLTCDVFVMGRQAAHFIGKIDYETGLGTWNGSGYKGDWTITRK